MEIIKCTIDIGLKKPVKVLHVTDSHLAFCDGRDNERKQALAKRGGLSNETKENRLREQLEYAKNNCDLLVHTGDLIDFVSVANAEYARELLKDEGIFYIAGNHEYSQYVGEAWEDMAYRMNGYMSLGDGLGVNMFFNSREIGGVNFVGIDNAYHQVEDWQTERLKAEIKKGLPIILMMHVPVFEQSLYEFSFNKHSRECAYIMGCDEEHLAPFTEFRSIEQRPKKSTKRFIEYISGESQIKAVLAGHVHFNFESRLKGGIPQYVTGGGFGGFAREITII